MGYIYKITNTINNKHYIGKTERDPEIRWKEHRRHAKTLDLPLYRAFNKYGINSFIFSIVEECPNNELDEKEIYWIDFYNSYSKGYNCTAGGEGGIKTYEEDIDEIIQRYRNGERLDLLCKEYHHDYSSIRPKLIEKGLIINTQAGPDKLSKQIYAIDPKTNQIIATYKSISAASRAICPDGHNPRAIANHISKQKNTNNICHGFLWRTSDS